MPDLVLARKLITDAAQKCVQAGALADRQAAFDQRRAGEWTTRRAALDDTNDAVKSCLVRIDDALKKADDLAKARDYIGADAAIDAALKEVDAAAALKAASERLNAKLQQLETDVAALTSATPRRNAPHIGPDVERLDAAVTKAWLGALRFAIDTTEAEVTAATVKYHVIKARKLVMSSGSSPADVKNQLAALNQQPGGAALLDDLIANLPAGGDSTKTVLAAMAIRFDLKGGANDEGTGARAAGLVELKRIYKLMASVPEKHTKDNPSLKQVTRKPSGGSDYNDFSGKINLGDGPGAINSRRTLADASELPAIDTNCQPEPTAPPPIFFDWNTQHEIAHALDDKKKFMASRAGDIAYGGWTDHGGNVLAVAEAAVSEFPGVGKEQIASYLDGGSEPFFKPTGWVPFKAWADSVRHGQSPWDAGAKCAVKASAGGMQIGTRVYHEAYDNHWFSYAAAARAQGITGYQFRAPGEWFSELYAAYKSKVLKPAHPAKPWLDKLFGVTPTP